MRWDLLGSLSDGPTPRGGAAFPGAFPGGAAGLCARRGGFGSGQLPADGSRGVGAGKRSALSAELKKSAGRQNAGRCSGEV